MTTGKKVAMGGGAVLVILLLAEVLLRVTLGLGAPPLVQADDEIGYLFQAEQDLQRFGNHVYINSYHQRSEELADDEGILRVLFIGDSVTWGGVLLDQQETYPEFFEAAIRATCERPVEALNASAGSWGIGNQQAYLERFGTFDSRVVVLQIGSHDLLQATSDASVVGTHPSFPEANPPLALVELVVRYAAPRLRNTLGAINFLAYARAEPQSHPTFNRNMQTLAAMIDTIRQVDGMPVVLYTPDRDEAVPEDTSYADRYEAYRPTFYALMDSLQVPVIDMLDQWRGGANTPAYFRDGVHLSSSGHQAVGEILHERLSDVSLAAACQN